ncbi:MAG: hypothetical protein L3V56_00595 [Candidatus Magnetoovum sp. WYHC-5]|nr:hypothetical protein [Candidatus Magnetoovum sp. WYHC-5]
MIDEYDKIIEETINEAADALVVEVCGIDEPTTTSPQTDEDILLSKYLKIAEALSILKGVQDEFCKEVDDMALVFDIKKDYRYRQGFEEGLKLGLGDGKEEMYKRLFNKGLMEGIKLAIEVKFGPNGLTVIENIKAVDDLTKIELIKESIKKASTVSEFSELINAQVL